MALRALTALMLTAGATTAWFLARSLDLGRPVVAFWLVMASPLAVHSTALWAIAPGAVCAGLAFAAGVRAGRTERSPVPWLIFLAAAIAAAILLRSEGALAAGALTVVLPALATKGRRVVTAAVPFVVGAMVYSLEADWIASIRGIESVQAAAAPGVEAAVCDHRSTRQPRRFGRAATTTSSPSCWPSVRWA